MNTPLAYSIVPMAPSHTSTRSSIASRNGFMGRLYYRLLIDLPIRQGLGIDEQIRPIDAVDADRGHTLPGGFHEPMVVPAEMKPRLHRGEQIVDDRLPGIAALRHWLCLGHDDERPRRFVRHQNVDAAELLACVDFLADEVPALVVFRRVR